jgi:hypothetical protein
MNARTLYARFSAGKDVRCSCGKQAKVLWQTQSGPVPLCEQHQGGPHTLEATDA